jgi:regulator of protease activity HflC (stomatin/prohibitin superfamily)
VIVVAGIAALAALAVPSPAVLREYERGVVFPMGHVRPVYRPGLRSLIPFVDSLIRVDQRLVTLTIPRQEVITRDNVPARVNAVVMFQVTDPLKAIMAVENDAVATSRIAQTTLRSLLGRADLDGHDRAQGSLRSRREFTPFPIRPAATYAIFEAPLTKAR